RTPARAAGTGPTPTTCRRWARTRQRSRAGTAVGQPCTGRNVVPRVRTEPRSRRLAPCRRRPHCRLGGRTSRSASSCHTVPPESRASHLPLGEQRGSARGGRRCGGRDVVQEVLTRLERGCPGAGRAGTVAP